MLEACGGGAGIVSSLRIKSEGDMFFVHVALYLLHSAQRTAWKFYNRSFLDF